MSPRAGHPEHCTGRRRLAATLLVIAAGCGKPSTEVIAGEAEHVALQGPAKPFHNDQELAMSAGDLHDDALHDAHGKLIAPVSDAAPAGAHAGDPLPPADPPAASVNLAHLRAALHALDAELTRLVTAARHATSRAEACKGIRALEPLYLALRVPDVFDGPPHGDDWGGHVASLIMVTDDAIHTLCGAAATASVEEVRATYDGLHAQLAQLLEMAAP